MNETQIPVHESWKGNLAMYGDKIVWMDLDGNYPLYMYDLSTSKETKLTNDSVNHTFLTDMGFCIYDDKIVWQGFYGETIYIYNTSTQEESKIPEESGKRHPAVYGNNIVWEDDRNGKMNDESWFIEGKDIYMYNLSTYQETQITNSGSATNPSIYGNRIVWSDNRSGNQGDIYLYDLSTNKEAQITNTGRANYPKIYEDRIVWEDNRSNIQSDIYMYNLSTHQETQITNDKSDQHTPDIYGNIIVWADDSNGEWFYSDIYMYDLLTSKETLITTKDYLCHDNPVIYGNRIAWMVRHYDNNSVTAYIYMANIDSNLPAASASPSSTARNVSSKESKFNFKMPKLSNEIVAALITTFGVILAAFITKKSK